MNKAEFDALFDDLVAMPLAHAEFERIGKSLILRDDLRTVALIRIGGRRSLPGCVSHVLCFRHSFLRDFDEAPPKTPPTEPLVYPFRYRPSLLQDVDESGWRYPRQHGYDYDTFDWSDRDLQEVHTWLTSLAVFVIGRFLPWTEFLTPQRALDQMVQFGEQVWCERLWIADYMEHLDARDTNLVN